MSGRQSEGSCEVMIKYTQASVFQCVGDLTDMFTGSYDQIERSLHKGYPAPVAKASPRVTLKRSVDG